MVTWNRCNTRHYFQARRSHTISKVSLSSFFNWVSTKRARGHLRKDDSPHPHQILNFGAIWYWQHEFKATQTPQMLPFDARTSRPWRPGERGRGECKSENAPGVTDCKFWTPPPPLRQLQSSPTTFSFSLQTMSSTVMSCLVSDNNNQNGRRSVHTSSCYLC